MTKPLRDLWYQACESTPTFSDLCTEHGHPITSRHKTKAFCLKTLEVAKENLGRDGAVAAQTFEQCETELFHTFISALQVEGLPFTVSLQELKITVTFPEGQTNIWFITDRNYWIAGQQDLAFFGVDVTANTSDRDSARLERVMATTMPRLNQGTRLFYCTAGQRFDLTLFALVGVTAVNLHMRINRLCEVPISFMSLPRGVTTTVGKKEDNQ